MCAAFRPSIFGKRIFEMFTLYIPNRFGKFQVVSEILQFSETMSPQKSSRYASKEPQISYFSKRHSFGKLLYLLNYLEFSKTVWNVKSKNLKYAFARMLDLMAANIYTYMGAESTVFFCLKWAVKGL